METFINFILSGISLLFTTAMITLFAIGLAFSIFFIVMWIIT